MPGVPRVRTQCANISSLMSLPLQRDFRSGCPPTESIHARRRVLEHTFGCCSSNAWQEPDFQPHFLFIHVRMMQNSDFLLACSSHAVEQHSSELAGLPSAKVVAGGHTGVPSPKTLSGKAKRKQAGKPDAHMHTGTLVNRS